MYDSCSDSLYSENNFYSSGSESPSFGTSNHFPIGEDHHDLPNEISAPYEVPQFPIEQIEKKLAIQRQLNYK